MQSEKLTKMCLAAIGTMVTFAGSASWAAGQCGPDQEKQKLTASDGAIGDFFGYAVSLSGNVAVVGAPDKNDAAGAAYVFRYDGTTWVEEQKLIPSDGAAQSLYGESVSVSGNVAVVGAFYANHDGMINAGSAYVFRYDGIKWVEEQKLIPSDAAEADYFGEVSVSGNVALVGARYDDHDGKVNAGSAHVFRYDGIKWVEEQKLTASDAAEHDSFGIVSVSGDLAVVGAPGYTDTAGPGAAYVFRYNGSSWVEEQKLTASDGADADQFGYSVSVGGNMALVGTIQDDDAGFLAGSAYVFRYDGTSWMQVQKLTASDPEVGDYFGYSVSVSGNVAVIGAIHAHSAYVFRYDGAAWLEEQKLTAGYAVSVNGNVAVIGTFGGEAAYVFGPPTPTWSNYGSGWPGTNGIPSFTLAGDPILCTTVTLNVGNSLGSDTMAVLFFGLAQTDQPTIYDGHLLVVPTYSFLLSLPAGGLALSGQLPCDPILCGDLNYAQVLQVDGGATRGVSFTRGLKLELGF